MRKFLFTLLATLVFALTACGASSGDVYAKDVIPARDWTTQEPTQQYQCNYEYGYHYDYFNNKYTYGLYNHCGNVTVGYHDEQHHEDACYKVMFKNKDGDKGDDCIGQTRWDGIEIGDFYERS